MQFSDADTVESAKRSWMDKGYEGDYVFILFISCEICIYANVSMNLEIDDASLEMKAFLTSIFD